MQSTDSDGNEGDNRHQNSSYSNNNASHYNLRGGDSPYRQFNGSNAPSFTAAPCNMNRRRLCVFVHLYQVIHLQSPQIVYG